VEVEETKEETQPQTEAEDTKTEETPAVEVTAEEPKEEAATKTTETAEEVKEEAVTEETKEEAPTEEENKGFGAEDKAAGVRPGMTVRVHQRIREISPKGEEKERVQIFEGIVLARKHGKEDGATITVRKISNGVGVEKIFPVHSPNVVKIEAIKQAKVGQGKLYFLRNWKKKLKETLIKNDK